MFVEIERKFLVRDERWTTGIRSVRTIRQGYVAEGPTLTARVRTSEGHGRLTLKSRAAGLARLEFNFELGPDDAERLLAEHRIGGLVEKKRHRVFWEGQEWDVDVFLGENAGLVVAEIEFADEASSRDFVPPPWAGAEVTGVERYYNASLARHPYRRWTVDERH